MLQVFQRYVASVCSQCFMMLHIFSHICCECFICMLCMFCDGFQVFSNVFVRVLDACFECFASVASR
jgi:hypothetical protein